MILPHLVDHIFMAFHVPLQTPWTPFAQIILLCPKKVPKNTCLCVYTTFKAILTCICNFWDKTHIHQEMCIKPKKFGVFLIESWINWLLAFPRPWEHSDSTLHFLFGVIYIEPLRYIEGGEIGEQGNYNSLLPHLFMLESASLSPFGEHNAALFKLAFALKAFHWDMEDWSGGGLGFSGSKKCWQRLSLLYLCLINRNIYFLSNTCA